MRIHHIAFRTADVARLATFYRDVVGLEERERRPNGAIWFAAGDAIVMVEQAAAGEPGIREGSMEFLGFCIEARERPAFVARLHAASIAVEAETDFTVYFRDPDGRRVGVSHFPAERPDRH